jgi:hypothetical protein
MAWFALNAVYIALLVLFSGACGSFGGDGRLLIILLIVLLLDFLLSSPRIARAGRET